MKTSFSTLVTFQEYTRLHLKSREESKCHCTPLIDALYSDVLSEFDKLRNFSIKFDPTTVHLLALDIPRTRKDNLYKADMIESRFDIALPTKTGSRYNQTFSKHFELYVVYSWGGAE